MGAPSRKASTFLEHHSLRQSTWYATSTLIIADIVGSGVLALPYAYAQLGWTYGSILLLACWPLNFFTGYLLNLVHLAQPRCVTFGDVGQKLWGPAGGYVLYGALYLYLLLVMGEYFIVLSDALQGVFYDWELCRPMAGLLCAMILLPSNQLRTLSGLTVLSIFSFLTILIVLGIYVGVISSERGGDVPCSSDEVVAIDGVMPAAKVISKFVFAFSGQKIFLEMQAEMKQPQQFVRSMNLAYPLLVAAYGVISVVTLARCPDSAPSYVLNAMGYNSARVWANLMIFAHIVVSYTLSQQVLSRAAAIRLLPGALQDGARGHMQWFVLSTTFMVVSYLLSNTIPLFEDFVSLLGALLSTQMTFSFPCLLYLGVRAQALHRNEWHLRQDLDRFLRITIYVVLVLDVLLTITGTIKAVQGIIQHASEGQPPFSCQCSALQCQSEGEAAALWMLQ